MAIIVPLLVFRWFSGGSGNTFGNSCRTMCAQRARKMYDEAAKERKKRKPAESVPDNCPEQSKGDARDQVGKAFGVSGRSVDRAGLDKIGVSAKVK